MTAPTWSPVDDATADLLSLVANDPHPSSEFEWRAFVGVLAATASLHDGRLDQNDYREQLRGVVAPKRIAAFHNRAIAERLIEDTGDWSISNDKQGRNSGRPVRVRRWIGDAA
jgi:hypothetical protein